MARTILLHEEPSPAADMTRSEAADAAALVTASSRLLGTSDPELAGFFASMTRYASPEDLLHYTPSEFAALVRHVFGKAKQRRAGESVIDIFDASENRELKRGESVLLTINDDVPFLYDSCTAEVRAQGHRIISAFHPVMPLSNASDERQSVIVLGLSALLDRQGAAELQAGLRTVFDDVRAAVRDWKPMLSRLAESRAALLKNPPPASSAELEESVAFLDWLADNHFTFLGCRDYRFVPEGEGRLDADPNSGLGVLSDPNRRVLRGANQPADLSPAAREFLDRPTPLIIAKSSLRSTVHRRARMDYIGVKRFGSKGELIGERRFVGLFTSVAYRRLPGEIPLLRLKAAHVVAGSGLLPTSHDGKALQHILDTFPRDELFEISEDELLSTALGILNLGQRPKVRLFVRFDKFDRYVSALLFVPRERYNAQVRENVHAILARAFNGRATEATPTLDDEALARVHYIVVRNPGPRPQYDARAVEEQVRAAIRTWDDDFIAAITAQYGTECPDLLRRYGAAFPAGYRDRFSATEAAKDVAIIDTVLAGQSVAAGVTAHVYAREGDAAELLRLKLFITGDFVPLSDCLPVFENLGLKAIAEAAYALTPTDKSGGARRISLQDFVMRQAAPNPQPAEQVKPLLENAFHAVWAEAAESDGFNKLVLAARLPWQQVALLRAVAKYLRQAGLTLSQGYMETALEKNPALAAMLVRLFGTLHDPQLFASGAQRAEAAKELREIIEIALGAVPSADEDRIIRAMLSVIEATLRTNFFQRNANGESPPYIALKLESGRVPVLPLPRPLYEIFVYAPEVEGVHLRFGKIARGGIRWSDRAEDFRSEVLSLAKAQQVKNAVIVPVGAKGGFFPKRIAPGAAREAVQSAGVSAYRLFIGALLDLTDNIAADASVIAPPQILRYDPDDPYLVVAADKGTATFSDIANEIAVKRGFWLGDAFASGGSEGYDHKKMGITARGAWEGIKRHFRELGRNVEVEPFTCIGIGDMSGDVFGNGMLYSNQTKLIAAFDHRHIFFDPTPDPAASWAERKRLFELPRSSWADYDPKLISPGGGVYPRSAKEIALTQPLKALTGIPADRAAPAEIIRALLTAPVDLLYFGGIGTFIKSSRQSNADAADRQNDAVRVNGRDVKALIIGEGANLAVTQLGRVEYAREGGREHQGGRINTDAIDNSAGVDTSDHEVNIKILLNEPLRRGEISPDQRLSLLHEMTQDVAQHVLQDNYDQTLALSVAELRAGRDLDAAGRFIRELERKGALDRSVESLPSDDDLRVLTRENRGLSRPELAILLAYAKIDLFHSLSESELVSDAYFDTWLQSYFPAAAASRFSAELKRHPLARAIIGTQIANRTVNLAGSLFAHRMRELSNAPLWCAARAFVLADGAFGLSSLKERICALDLKAPAQLQNTAIAEVAELLRRLGLWFIVQLPDAPLGPTIGAYSAGFAALKGRFSKLISDLEKKLVEARIAELLHAGVPFDLAEDIAILPLLSAVPEIIMLSDAQRVSAWDAARVYFAVGATIGLDRLRALSARIPTSDHWDRLALRRIVDDLYAAQRLISAEVLSADGGEGAAAVGAWRDRRRDDIDRTLNFLAELERSGDASLAKLALANSQIQKIASQAPTQKR